jgi:CNT family concentrative nucleoside transporter
VGSNFVFAFQSLPLILIISAVSALLFYWNIIPPIVRGFAWLLRRAIGVDGPAGIAVTMNIFVGMVEAPLVIRPYLRTETRAGLFVIMTAGMAMIAGTVMVLYATMLEGVIPNPIGQLLTASVMAAPATIVIAYIMIPEDPAVLAAGRAPSQVILPPSPGDNMMSVITKGTLDGVQILINVIAMLVVLVALVSLANAIIGLLPDVAGAPLTLQRMFGWVMSPVAWLLGVPWSEAGSAGGLLGTKTVLNELIAYTEMAKLPAETLSERSRLIMTYALCGFANFGSVGITIGGLAAMVPERRADIIALAPRTMVSGTLATCLSGAIVGMLS